MKLASRVILILCFLLNVSCSFFGLYQNAYDSAKSFLNPRPFELTPQILALPYAMQLVEHRKAQSIMILSHAYNGNLAWVDAENNGFTTLNGKVISTNGIANNLEIINAPDILKVFVEIKNDSRNIVREKSLVRFRLPETAFFDAKHLFYLNIKSDDRFKRKIDGKLLKYYILEEIVEISSINWRFTNKYWLSENGKILKSKQYLSPDEPKYFIEILKDYSAN